MILAIAILSYLLVENIKFSIAWIQRSPFKAMIIFGLLAGILGGLTNVMGPVLIIYSLESRHSKGEIIQAANLCFLLGKTAQLILFIHADQFGGSELTASIFMLIGVFTALGLSYAVKQRIQPQVYKRMLRFILLGLAIILLVQSFINYYPL